jgi:hypothetical protein
MIKLTEKQQEIIDSPARVKLVMGGHRSGKTILAIMAAWDILTKSTSHPRALFLIPGDRYQRHVVEEIRRLLYGDIISVSKEQANIGNPFVLIRTNHGDIFVSDHFIHDSFDGTIFDNATSNNYLTPEILESRERLYFTGHCPDDMNNAFFLMWLKAYFSNNSDIKAFHLNTLDNPSMDEGLKERGEQLCMRMGESKYNRDYLCIPDYLDCLEPKPNGWHKDDFFISSSERNNAEFNRHYLGKW